MKKVTLNEMNRLSPEEYKHSGKVPLIVILDNIRSLHNVGSVFRTCDAFRIEKIFLCGLTCPPPHPEIHKTALGAEFSVDWSYSGDILQSILTLKEKNYTILAIEQVHGSQLLNETTLKSDKKYAVVFGNEVNGVQQSVLDICDGSVEIPQYGTKHSINVSVAAGIVLWHFFQKWMPLVKL